MQQTKGFSSSYSGFTRKADKPSASPTAKSIDLNISSYFYNVHYDYDVSTNSYKRSEGGQPHTDERSAMQLSPKVVIAIVVPKGIASDHIHSTYEDIGTGKAYIFQDAIETDAIWAKTDRTAQIKFTDSNGTAIPINAGQTWISLVGLASDVSFKP
ncbi:DUF3048 C-terminal domain-containing protein [Candidatus Saccharibacteria bacterium]|nr:DUF3048 C-terminal domain-containing protein [Candidatus Saccharibacteria bacterium]